MPRQARLVVPNTPHHVTQRGNRRQVTFFQDADYLLYLQLAKACFAEAGLACWLYCLMPNHVHFIVVPPTEDALRKAFAPLHAAYTRAINARERWSGYLWQGRFASFAMDEDHAHQAIRYVGLNPVRAGLVRRARDWPWSNVAALLDGRDDPLAPSAPVMQRLKADRPTFFDCDITLEGRKKLRRASATGAPLGASAWVKALEAATGRTFEARPPGRPAKDPSRQRREGWSAAAGKR